MKASVVMPVYNGEQFLTEAIDSILSQSWRDYEFIIIDDRSTDTSPEILRLYSCKDLRIKIITHDENRGIAESLNDGIAMANAEYIVRMDADDISLPTRIEKQIEYMDSHPDIAACGSNIIVQTDGESTVRTFDTLPQRCQANMLFFNCMAHPSMIIRKQFLTDHNLKYQKEYEGLEDFRLWWDICKFGKISNINETLLIYRVHDNQATKKPISDERKQLEREFLRERLRDKEVTLDDTHLDLLSKYIDNDLTFSIPEIEHIITAFQEIASTSTFDHKEILNVVSGALVNIVSCSINDKSIRQKILLKAYKSGALSLRYLLRNHL